MTFNHFADLRFYIALLSEISHKNIEHLDEGPSFKAY